VPALTLAYGGDAGVVNGASKGMKWKSRLRWEVNNVCDGFIVSWYILYYTMNNSMTEVYIKHPIKITKVW